MMTLRNLTKASCGHDEGTFAVEYSVLFALILTAAIFAAGEQIVGGLSEFALKLLSLSGG